MRNQSNSFDESFNGKRNTIKHRNSLFARSIDPDLDKKKKIANIGSLDKLGNFCLNPKIATNLDTDELSYWDKLKSEFRQRSEQEIKREANKIISEVFTEVLHNNPNESCETLETFLK